MSVIRLAIISNADSSAELILLEVVKLLIRSEWWSTTARVKGSVLHDGDTNVEVVVEVVVEWIAWCMMQDRCPCLQRNEIWPMFGKSASITIPLSSDYSITQWMIE